MSDKSEKERLLLLTQDPHLVERAKAALEDEGRHLVAVRELSVLEPLLERGAHLALVDLSLPSRALEAASAILDRHRELPVLVLGTTAGDWHRVARGNPLEEMLEAPFPAQKLRARVEQLLDKSRFLRERLVGRSELMQEVRERVLLIAPTPITVLITGESGTGKEEIARALHRYSLRSERPFKDINCAAIPGNLLENELFGHEKGSFTDARSQYRGLFEQAEGGTVFLDEIGEMSLAAQVRLLRVLEQRQVTRIGGSAALPVDIRIVAATNKDLQKAMVRGEFRRDLYHRLKVVEIYLPPLRRRREDIPLLIEHFVALLGRENPVRFNAFSPEAMELLVKYDWPGNIRELRNLVEHLVFLGPRGQVEPADLLPHLEGAAAGAPYLPVATGKSPEQSERELIYFALLDLKREVAQLRHLIEGGAPAPEAPVRAIYPLEESNFSAAAEKGESAPVSPQVPHLVEVEREAIQRALARVGGHRKKAAELLGIGVRTLYRKLDKYALREEDHS